MFVHVEGDRLEMTVSCPRCRCRGGGAVSCVGNCARGFGEHPQQNRICSREWVGLATVGCISGRVAHRRFIRCRQRCSCDACCGVACFAADMFQASGTCAECWARRQGCDSDLVEAGVPESDLCGVGSKLGLQRSSPGCASAVRRHILMMLH